MTLLPIIRSLIITIVLACMGMAQDVGRRLTLEEAVELAIKRNPEMLVALEDLAELKGRITEVRSGAYPQVTLQGYGLRMRDPSILNSSSFDKVPKEFKDALVPSANNMFDIGVNVKQPIYNAGKVRTALRLAEESLGEKKSIGDSVRQQLTFKVFQAFNDLLLAEANRDVVLETYLQRTKHLEQARDRFKNGVATEIDVLRSEVNVANMEPDRIRADNQVRFARAAINDLIVEDLESPTQIAGSLEYHPWAVGGLEEIQKRTLELRPELNAARKMVQQAKLTLSLANAENRLTVDMEGQWGYAVREPQNVFNNDFSRWNLTFNFKLPLFDSGRKAGLTVQAMARVRSAEQRLAQLENTYRLDVKRAYDDMQSSAKSIAAAKLSVGQAETVLVLMQANYQYGAATTLDVLDSQTALAVARNAQIGATYEYEMAKARLRLASGQSNPRWGGTSVNSRSSRFSWILILILAAGTQLNCGKPKVKDRENPGAALSPALVVKAVPVARRDWIVSVSITGNLRSLSTVEIKPEVGGRLIATHFVEGDLVHKGQMLAEIDPVNYRLSYDQADAALQVAQAGLERAKVSADHARTEKERADNLLKSGGITEKDHQAALTGIKEAESQVRLSQAQCGQARAALAIAEKALQDCMIYSPIDGHVQKRYFDRGSLLSPGVAVYTIVDNKQLELECVIPSYQLAKLRLGQGAAFKTPTYGERAFDGIVSAINPEVESENRSVTVRLKISNPRGELRSGMYARGEIVAHKEENALVIPRDSLIAEKDESVRAGVYVVQGGAVHRIAIEIGDTQVEDVWVSKGLKEGELVISEIGPSLKEGIAVQIAR